jgi:hypothetical protein
LLAGDQEVETTLNIMVTDSTVSQYHTGLWSTALFIGQTTLLVYRADIVAQNTIEHV